jgi:hypothetical protein
MTTTEIEVAAKAAGQSIPAVLIFSGVSRTTWWRWKTGKFQPRASSLARINIALAYLTPPTP